eukprot:4561763-Prymnesium_polylepis.1
MILGPEELKKGGKRAQLGSGQPPALAARARATVQAIWLYMYNNGRSSNSLLQEAVLRAAGQGHLAHAPRGVCRAGPPSRIRDADGQILSRRRLPS